MRKRVKWFILIALSLILFMEGANINVFAASGELSGETEESAYEELFYIPSIYQDRISIEDLRKPEDDSTRFAIEKKKASSYTSIGSAGDYLREKAVNKVELVTLVYKTSDDYVKAWYDVLDEALKNTGNPKEGDYIRFQTVIRGQAEKASGGWLLTYALTYFLSSEQEREMDTAVNALKQQLNLTEKTDYEMIYDVNHYIIDNVIFDNDHWDKPTYYLQYTGYGALIDGQAAWIGFTVLMYRMMMECGIDCCIISGGDIQWCIVKLGELYYYVDPSQDYYNSNDGYFLVGQNTMDQYNSYVEVEVAVMEPYTTEAFKQRYPISELDYDTAIPCITRTEAGTDQITVRWNAADGATKYQLWRKTQAGGWEVIFTSTSTQFIDNSLPMGKFSYKVRGMTADGWTGYSGTISAYINPFRDVSGENEFFEALSWAYNNGIIVGTSKTSFSPNSNCTRAQFAAMLWKLNGKPSAAKLSNPFSDVEETNSFRNPIVWCYHNNIVSGTSATTFSPKANITRWQIMTMLWRMVGKPKSTLTSNPFTDVKTTDAFYKAALWAYEKRITSVKTFKPKDNCTRWQLVVFLYKVNQIYQYIG